MIALGQTINTEIFAFIAVLVLFINRKYNRSCENVGYFLRK